MPSLADRSRRALAYGILAALVVLAAIGAYLTMAPGWRPAGVRLGCTAVVIAGSIRAVRAVRRKVEMHPPSAFDAPVPAASARELDGSFRRQRDDVVLSLRSRQYFDAILWPRLQEMAGGRLVKPGDARRRGRRGPTLPELEALIAEAERRP